jgi:hypothetical protein
MKYQRNRVFEHAKVDLKYDNLHTESEGDARIYITPDKKRYPSITTVLGSTDKTFLIEWRKRVGDAEADRVGHHARIRGTAVHLLAEQYLNNEDIDVSKLMPHVKQGFLAAQKVLDARVGKVVMQECPLYSDHLEIAGRVDLVAEFDSLLSIVDFKTSKEVRTKDDITNYFIQAAFYAAAFYERTGIPIRQIVIVMLVDGSSNPLVFIEEPFKWLKMLLKIRKSYKKAKNL